MIAIAIRFPSGRYHSTPWGHHVNEGNPEWPPSPWRFLRSLVATWKRKLDGESGFDTDAVRALLEELASPPDFFLPPASTAHSRHYMPWDKGWQADEPEKAKTKVFDAFVALDRTAEVIVRWADATLDAQRSRLLDALLANIAYLGRSESWAAARLLSEREATACVPNCMPLNGHSVDADQEPLRSALRRPADDVRQRAHAEARGDCWQRRNKQTITSPLYDPDWHLCLETLELHNKKWSDPPGSRWVTYLRPDNCYEVKPVRRPVRANRTVTLARYALDGSVLPLATEALAVAEKVRITLMGIFKRLKLREHYGREVPSARIIYPVLAFSAARRNRGNHCKGIATPTIFPPMRMATDG